MISLRDVGELRIIRTLERILGTDPRTLVGFGDDVSAVKLAGGKVIVLKTDMLVGSTDVPPGMTMFQAARKAVVANVSDMAAKGVRPDVGLVALGLPISLTAAAVKDLASGLRAGADEYGVSLIGGDTNESRDLNISIALFALADRSQLVLRKTAKPGNIVAVSGDFGDASAGLKAVLEKGIRPKHLPKPIYNAVYRPRAELGLGLALAKLRVLDSSIDSSDGLAWSLHELAKASNVGIMIEKIPVSKASRKFAEESGCNAYDLALYGGEEYHLVVTMQPSKFDLAQRVARGRLRRIGFVTRRFKGVRMLRDGRQIRIERKGWEHFKR